MTDQAKEPYLPLGERRRVMALELALSSFGKHTPTMAQVTARARLFEAFISRGEMAP